MFSRIGIVIFFLSIFFDTYAQKKICDSLLEKSLYFASDNQDSIALVFIEKALECSTNKAYEIDLRLNKANILYNLNEKEKAAIEYAYLVKSQSKYPQAYSRYAEYLMSLKTPDYNIVLNYLLQATQMLDSSAETLTKLGIAYSRTNRNDLAVDVLSKSIAKNPDLSISYFHRGFAEKEVGLYNAAILDLTYFLNLYPNDIPALYNLGFGRLSFDILNIKNIEDITKVDLLIDSIINLPNTRISAIYFDEFPKFLSFELLDDNSSIKENFLNYKLKKGQKLFKSQNWMIR
jgi:tetratricopeptide (TPR) repeat protein